METNSRSKPMYRVTAHPVYALHVTMGLMKLDMFSPFLSKIYNK